MKKIIISLLVLVLNVFYMSGQPCPFDDITFTSQEQIDNFAINYPNCTQVVGSMMFHGDDDGDITNLDGLSQITSITEGLQILNTTGLQDLSGLENLVTIGDDLYIDDNTALTNLTGLTSLTAIGGDAIIEQNPGLEQITGLNQLTDITKALYIEDNPNLLSISGFNGLQNVKGILISNNESQTSLAGFDGINTITEYLIIADNEELLAITGFSQLVATGTRLTISDNIILENIATFNMLQTVGTTFRIAYNEELLNIANFSSLEEIGANFEIITNENLQDLTPSGVLTSIGGDVILEKNYSLTDVTGLSGVSKINGTLELNSNLGLSNLTGFNNITSANYIFIEDMDVLDDLSPFSSLDTVFFDLTFGYGNAFINCVGLESLEHIGRDLNIGISSFSSNNLQNLTGLEGITRLKNLNVLKNNNLVSFSGLNNLVTVEEAITIQNNHALTDLSAISNVVLTGVLDTLVLTMNDQLSFCGQDNICNYITGGGGASIEGNAAGCSDMNEVIGSCFVMEDHTSFIGKVYADTDQNCSESAGDVGLPNAFVSIENDQYSYGVTTDAEGNYWLPAFAGEYHINVISPTSFWQPCFVDSILLATATNDSITTDLYMSPLGDCPYLDWDLTLTPLRICGSRFVVLDYCNYGAQPAEDAIFSIQLDSFLTIDSASIPYTVDTDGNYLFELDTVGLFECGQIVMSVFTDCDGVELDQIHCIQVDLMSDDLCSPDGLWDGSIITASGYCENDSVFFNLQNIGMGNMSETAQFRVDILIDDIVLLHDADDYQLPSGAIRTIAYPINNENGFYLEADQTSGFPLEADASAVVPNCNDALNDILLTLFPLDNGDPFSETFCTFSQNSFDPNIKTTIPVGVGDDHEIEKDWELDYTIQFQNTGNDVAYLVVIKDNLSENVDLSTLRVKGASHDFTWALNPERELVFTFDNILLPDSTTNEPASHGFVSYSIQPKATILPGERIENKAAIYFDFNDPIITNTVFHTIKKPIVVGTEDLTICEGTLFNNQLITQDTSIQELTEFTEYDSIHLYHLMVLPQTNNTISTTVQIGETFEGILINGDTSIIVSYTGSNGCDSIVTYTISGLVNTNEVSAFFAEIYLYPNPVDELLRIANYRSDIPQDWRLVNALGKSIWHRALGTFETLEEISVSDVPAGVYWLEVRSKEGGAVWRVVVE